MDRLLVQRSPWHHARWPSPPKFHCGQLDSLGTHSNGVWGGCRGIYSTDGEVDRRSCPRELASNL
eukprot:2616979-Amphidinium_carterae.1